MLTPTLSEGQGGTTICVFLMKKPMPLRDHWAVGWGWCLLKALPPQDQQGAAQRPLSSVSCLSSSFAVLVITFDFPLGIYPSPLGYETWDYANLDPEGFWREGLMSRSGQRKGKVPLKDFCPLCPGHAQPPSSWVRERPSY